jgi:hypothetical protein
MARNRVTDPGVRCGSYRHVNGKPPDAMTCSRVYGPYRVTSRVSALCRRPLQLTQKLAQTCSLSWID